MAVPVLNQADSGRRPAGRDRVADAVSVGAAAALGVLFVVADWSSVSSTPVGLVRELGVGVAACVAVLLARRRWPVGLALVLVVGGTALSTAAFGVTFVALFNVAVRRSWRVTAAVAGLHLVTASAAIFLVAGTSREFREGVVTVFLLDAVLVVSGMLVRSQRQLVRSLQERARQAEEGQRLRIEEARRLERERIAREMHDVLAHRISLLAMHAGALEFRPDAPAAQVTRAAGVIRACAFEALEDLRELVGMLREADGAGAGAGAEAERPQPTMADLPELVADSRRAATHVSLDNRIGSLGAVPAGIGRHAYRIVQEGLTNARKHAPGYEVRVVVEGAPGHQLTVELRNRLPSAVNGVEVPGAGAGLIGLRERTDLAGGRLEHGRTLGGDFRLWASLPWPA